VCEKRADVQVENVMMGIMAGTVNSTKSYFSNSYCPPPHPPPRWLSLFIK